MEEILGTYKLPYKEDSPVVCMDEKLYQMLDQVLNPLPMKPGSIRKEDAEYSRKGTCSIFVFAQPLAYYRHTSVRKNRTMVDWAQEIEYLLTVIYPDKKKIILLMNNLNTHISTTSSMELTADPNLRLCFRIFLKVVVPILSCNVSSIGISIMNTSIRICQLPCR